MSKGMFPDQVVLQREGFEFEYDEARGAYVAVLIDQPEEEMYIIVRKFDAVSGAVKDLGQVCEQLMDTVDKLRQELAAKDALIRQLREECCDE
jgi:hypothetical protein